MRGQLNLRRRRMGGAALNWNRNGGGNVDLDDGETGAGVLVDCSGGEHRLPVFNKCL